MLLLFRDCRATAPGWREWRGKIVGETWIASVANVDVALRKADRHAATTNGLHKIERLRARQAVALELIAQFVHDVAVACPVGAGMKLLVGEHDFASDDLLGRPGKCVETGHRKHDVAAVEAQDASCAENLKACFRCRIRADHSGRGARGNNEAVQFQPLRSGIVRDQDIANVRGRKTRLLQAEDNRRAELVSDHERAVASDRRLDREKRAGRFEKVGSAASATDIEVFSFALRKALH